MYFNSIIGVRKYSIDNGIDIFYEGSKASIFNLIKRDITRNSPL